MLAFDLDRQGAKQDEDRIIVDDAYSLLLEIKYSPWGNHAFYLVIYSKILKIHSIYQHNFLGFDYLY